MATIKSIEENENELWKTYTSKMNEKIAQSDAIYDKQAETTSVLYDGKIGDAQQEYDDLSRQNEVQKYINAREVAENNANLGLTDSGLNRTQQTAVQLSASNNAAKIERQRQSAVDELTRLMTADLAEIEGNKSTAQMNIRSGYEDLVNKAAVAKYEADWEAETARIQAEAKSKNEQKATDLSRLTTHLKEYSYDKEYCAKLIDEYAFKYGIDDLSSEMTALLKIADISLDDLDSVVKGNSPQKKSIPLKERNWNLVNNGGVNGFLGLGKLLGNIDDNAKVSDGEKEYTMAELSTALQEEGFTKEQAKNYIVYLQKELGAH